MQKTKALKRMSKKHGLKIKTIKMDKYNPHDFRGMPLFLDEIPIASTDLQIAVHEAMHQLIAESRLAWDLAVKAHLIGRKKKGDTFRA